jgi:hypothetical protein
MRESSLSTLNPLLQQQLYAWRSPVVRLHVLVIDELVVALGGEVEGAGDDANRGEDKNGPRRSDEVEARVEVPAVPEAGVVVVEEGLRV